MNTAELVKQITNLPSEEKILGESIYEAKEELEAAREAVRCAEEKVNGLRREARKQRREREHALVMQWRAHLAEEHGYDLPESLLNKLFTKAYELSNGSGYYDEESHFIELAMIAREARSA